MPATAMTTRTAFTPTRSTTARMPAPPFAMGFVIGKQGATIRTLAAESGAEVRVNASKGTDTMSYAQLQAGLS